MPALTPAEFAAVSLPMPRARRHRHAIEQVFRQFARRVYNLSMRVLGNDADAHDVTQDVMVQVVRKLDTFRGESALPTWLHRVTVNAALAHRRRAGRFREVRDENLDDHPVQHRDFARLADREQIERAIAELPEMYREVLVMSDMDQMSNAYIADVLGLNVPAVKSRLHRARNMMRERLAPYFSNAN